MAPNRGLGHEGALDELDPTPIDTPLLQEHEYVDNSHHQQQQDFASTLADRANDDTNLTVRGILVGSVIGIIICFSNTYFGLQTGWISGMAMPGKTHIFLSEHTLTITASLIGFAFFKSIARFTTRRFT